MVLENGTNPASCELPSPAERVTKSQEHAAAIYAPLLSRPQSGLAIDLCAELLTDLMEGRQKRKPRKKQHDAFGGMIADLLERDPEDLGGWLFRATRPEGFTGEAIGYRVFQPIFKAMEGTLIETETGKQHRTNSELTAGEWATVGQVATRFRATDCLRRWFAERGICRENWSSHFGQDANAVSKAQSKRKICLILRGGKPPKQTKLTKRPALPINRKDPAIAAMIARLEKLNDYLASQVVEPFGPTIHLKRIFAEGHLPDHNWRQGGRLYAVGKGSYQNAKPEARKAITLNGLPTVELDLQSSHLTILAGMGHLPLQCLQGDPYAIEGIPRSVVKKWITMTLGHGKRHGGWPGGAVKEFLAKEGIDLKKEFPAKATGDAILAKLPILHGEKPTVPLGWGELQFIESEVIMTCMETLAYDHDVPSLPVHDSLIVPTEAESLAKKVIIETFKARLGVCPVIGG